MPYKDPEKRKAYHRKYLCEWRKQNLEKVRGYKRKHYQKRPDLYLAAARRQRARHPEKIRERHRKWVAKNREHVRTYGRLQMRRYIKENREKVNKRQREWDRNNREQRKLYSRRHYRKNHTKELQRMKKYRDTHREVYRQHDKLRKARNRSSLGRCSKKQWLQRCEYFGWRCVYCGKPLTPKTVTMDHQIPITRGGTNWPSNLVPACAKCNGSKHNKLPSEWKN